MGHGGSGGFGSLGGGGGGGGGGGWAQTGSLNPSALPDAVLSDGAHADLDATYYTHSLAKSVGGDSIEILSGKLRIDGNNGTYYNSDISMPALYVELTDWIPGLLHDSEDHMVVLRWSHAATLGNWYGFMAGFMEAAPATNVQMCLLTQVGNAKDEYLTNKYTTSQATYGPTVTGVNIPVAAIAWKRIGPGLVEVWTTDTVGLDPPTDAATATAAGWDLRFAGQMRYVASRPTVYEAAPYTHWLFGAYNASGPYDIEEVEFWVNRP